LSIILLQLLQETAALRCGSKQPRTGNSPTGEFYSDPSGVFSFRIPESDWDGENHMHTIQDGASLYFIEVEDPKMEDLLEAGVPFGVAERAFCNGELEIESDLSEAGLGVSKSDQ
jgi:hypothetical protein